VTGTLVAAALGAPFAFPRLLDSHGSAVFAPQAAAPATPGVTVVHMAVRPRPERVAHPRRTPVQTTPATPRLVVSSGASLASVRTRTAPAAVHASRPAAERRSIRKHAPGLVVDSAPAAAPVPAPAPALPTASVTQLSAQPSNIDTRSGDTASAPTPAPAAAPAPVAVPDSGGDGTKDRKHGGKDDEQKHGHGHDH
jgi:hypothetical protein